MQLYVQSAMSKVVQAIVFLAHQSVYKYSSLFTVTPSLRESFQGGEENCVVDLNFVRFTVKKDNNGVKQFAGLVAGALADTSGNSITAEQVLDVLDKIERLGEIEHNEMDMMLDQTGEENLSGIESNFKFTVRGWQRRNRTQNVHGFKPKWLDATKKLHQQSSQEDRWRYWPHETYGGNACKVNTRAIVMDEAKYTGTIRISTAFINRAQDPNFAREFEQSLTEVSIALALWSCPSLSPVAASPPMLLT